MPKKQSLNRPFRGLRALGLAKPATPNKKTFADAMKSEGTRPLPEAVRRVPPSRVSRPKASLGSAPSFEIERDDEWVEGYRSGTTANVRRRLGGTPTTTLDLHRHDADTARRRVASFVAGERERGRELVLVIVGRGHHSPGGQGVLRGEIADWLTTPPTSAHVLAFRTARPDLGGSGAVVVLLRR